MDPCRSVGDGGDASRRYLYTPVSITQADNECRLEGDKTHEIFHFLSKKSGGDISYVVPTKLKSGGGDASPPVPHRSTPVVSGNIVLTPFTGTLRRCSELYAFHRVYRHGGTQPHSKSPLGQLAYALDGIDSSLEDE